MSSTQPQDPGGGVKSPAKESSLKKSLRPAESDLLLPGWVIMSSRTKGGLEYYFNKKLRVSQWTKPTEEQELTLIKASVQVDPQNAYKKKLLEDIKAQLKKRVVNKDSPNKTHRKVCTKPSSSETKRNKPDQIEVKTEATFKRSFNSMKDMKDVSPEKSKKIKPHDGPPKVSSNLTRLLQLRTGSHAKSKLGRSTLNVFTDSEQTDEHEKQKPVPQMSFTRRRFLESLKRLKNKFEKEKEVSKTSKTSSQASRGNSTKYDNVQPHKSANDEPEDIITLGNRSGTVPSARLADEEAMEVEEYTQLLTDIKDIRQDFHSLSTGVNGELSERFFSSECGRISPQENLENKKPLYIVVDTNVLLNSLQLLQSLCSYDENMPQGYDLPCLVIPWVVISELDYIKDNKHNKVTEKTQQKARMAVHFLHEHLEKHDPRLVGQKPSEATKKFEELGDASSNDDKVLQCCIQWQHKYQRSGVFLLTGDTNLRSKAIILDISAYSERTLMQWLKNESNSTIICDKKNSIERTNVPSSTSSHDLSFANFANAQCFNATSPESSARTSSFHTSPDRGTNHLDISLTSPHTPNSSFIRTTLNGSSYTRGLIDMDFAMESKSNTSCNTEFCASSQADNMEFHSSTDGASSADTQSLNPFMNALTKPFEEDIPKSTVKSRSGIFQVKNATGKSEEKASHQKLEPPLRTLQDEVWEKVRTCMQSSLGEILESTMKHIYDDIWEEIVFKKPPWSLEDILESIKKHWNSVFGDLFGRRNISRVTHLLSCIASSQNSWSSLTETISKSLRLCEEYKDPRSDKGLVPTIGQLKKLYLIVKAAWLKNLPDSEVSAMLFSSHDSGDAHQHNNSTLHIANKISNINTSINNIGDTISPSCHFMDDTLHGNQKKKIDATLTQRVENLTEIIKTAFQRIWEHIVAASSEIRMKLQDVTQAPESRVHLVREFSEFCLLVACIHEQYAALLPGGKEEHQYDKLCMALSRYALRYNIQPWEEMTGNQLRLFHCQSQENSLVLQNGFNQLENMLTDISGCNNFLCPQESTAVQAAINIARGVT